MGFVPVILGAVACYMSKGHAGSTTTFWIAAVGALGAFWSYGVMHNYATAAARKRASYEEGFHDFTKSEVESVPNRLALINLVCSVLCALAFVASLWKRIAA